MKLPNNVDVSALVESLRQSAQAMILVDGDRDYMNTSRLTCQQTQGAYELMLLAASVLAGVDDADPAIGR